MRAGFKRCSRDAFHFTGYVHSVLEKAEHGFEGRAEQVCRAGLPSTGTQFWQRWRCVWEKRPAGGPDRSPVCLSVHPLLWLVKDNAKTRYMFLLCMENFMFWLGR